MAYEDVKNVQLGPDNIAVCLAHGLFGSHLGMAFYSEEGDAKMLHLANHRRLKLDTYEKESHPGGNWIAHVVAMEPLHAIQLIALARLYAERHEAKENNHSRSPNYGMNLLAGRGTIDSMGAYTPTENSDGFTCASIIAEIFSASGYGLVNLDNWSCSDENRIWGEAIICMLKASEVPKSHIEHVSKSFQGLRLLPEEVAAAAELQCDDLPAEYLQLGVRSLELTQEILKKCGTPLQIPAGHVLAKCVQLYQKTRRPAAQIIAPALTVQGLMASIASQPATKPICRFVPVGRNDPCPCGSAKKYKKCHGA
ncbi:SEC-C metal-binding domain-containing protein [Janthinobacterium sp. GW458P]|uniref:SEC-C metal-binding domain-containing protein n=1 Tax=Janthinobacterium sp. GW458P TaxID=1981504 RepID=UPI000A32965F|nr:SEC-C metal-binding domain-containing protein [Janthinobacterium sp. GW458P]